MRHIIKAVPACANELLQQMQNDLGDEASDQDKIQYCKEACDVARMDGNLDQAMGALLLQANIEYHLED